MIVLPFVLSPWESRLSYNIPQYFNGADSLAAVCTAFLFDRILRYSLSNFVKYRRINCAFLAVIRRKLLFNSRDKRKTRKLYFSCGC